MATDCLEEVLEKFKGKVTRSELKPHFDSLTDAKKTGTFAKLESKIKKRSEDELLASLQTKANDLIALKNLQNFVKESGVTPSEFFLSKATGLSRAVKGGNLSFESMRNTLRGRFYNMAHSELWDIAKQLKTGALDVDWAEATLALNRGESIGAFDPIIQKAAKTLHALNEVMFEELANAGQVIKKRVD